MQEHDNESRTRAHTQSKPDEYWEFIKNLFGICLVICIAYILLTAGGVL